ncbi:hypothetical protein [Neptunicoccus cionae]|uniref:Uncharacterized protein n=1 Tax=Neptunicoccus cionae TaxID=2035344 RepID=A0A916R4U2_9RHOB|nr:hypothetical protein [Amylibacter cionae]GGA34065.1 hypothetical protein GCM10011498_39040 [Amylibacter cionae]
MMRLIWVVVALALLRNLFPPNSFTATVLIFDYEHGLVRRGFWGEILNLYWGETVSKSEVFVASALLTLAGLAALLAAFTKWCASSFAGARWMLLFVCSFAFSALIASTGYIDLALVGLVSLMLFTDPRRALGVALRCLAVFAGMFMHEVMLPYFAVFLVYEIWLSRPTPRRGLIALSPLLVGIAALVGLSLWGQLPQTEVADYIAHIEAKSEFSAEPEATIVMERSLSDNLAMMAEKRGMLDYRSWILFDGLPLLAMSLWLIVMNLRLLGSSAGTLTRVLLVGAILAPLSLNIIAFDVVRFGTISVLIGFLAVLSLLRTDPSAVGRLDRMLGWPLMVIVLVLNLHVTVNQMNTGDRQDYGAPWAITKQLDWLR